MLAILHYLMMMLHLDGNTSGNIVFDKSEDTLSFADNIFAKWNWWGFNN